MLRVNVVDARDPRSAYSLPELLKYCGGKRPGVHHLEVALRQVRTGTLDGNRATTDERDMSWCARLTLFPT